VVNDLNRLCFSAPAPHVDFKDNTSVDDLKNVLGRTSKLFSSYKTSTEAEKFGFLHSVKSVVLDSKDKKVDLNFVIHDRFSVFGTKPIRDDVLQREMATVFEVGTVGSIPFCTPHNDVEFLDYESFPNMMRMISTNYFRKPPISPKARYSLEYYNKLKYYTVLQKISREYSPRIRTILIVGCGANNFVDLSRLEKSGLFDACEKQNYESYKYVDCVDPALPTSTHEYHERIGVLTQDFKMSFHDFVEQRVDDSKKYDLIIFPMSFHAISSEYTFFENMLHICDERTMIVGMMPNPDIYNNPIYAAMAQNRPLHYDPAKDAYLVQSSMTGGIFYDKKVDLHNLSLRAFNAHFILQFGTSQCYDLYHSHGDYRNDNIFTVTMHYCPLEIRNYAKLDTASLYSRMKFERGRVGLYDKFIPNHAGSASYTQLLRTLGDNTYFSDKLDGVEALMAVTRNSFVLERSDGYMFRHEKFEIEHLVAVFQVELMFEDRKIKEIVLVDVVHDASSFCGTTSMVDRGNASFCWRSHYIGFISERLNLRSQVYRRRSEVGKFSQVKEGVVMTPAHSSRVVLNKKAVTGGSCHVKRCDEQDFRLPFEIKFGNTVVMFPIDFVFKDNSVVATRVRPNKTGKSIPHQNSFSFEQFLEYNKTLMKYTRDTRVQLRDPLGFDSYFLLTRFTKWLYDSLGSLTWLTQVTPEYSDLAINCDHYLGSDDCHLCKRYLAYKSSNDLDRQFRGVLVPDNQVYGQKIDKKKNKRVARKNGTRFG